MKVLVTGASGFVGSRTCSLLEASGHDVIRITHSHKVGLESEYAIDIGDLSTFEQLKDLTGIDAIIHCAGIAHRFKKTSKEEFWRVNVEGTKNIAAFAVRMNVGRLVLLSSVLVYGVPTSNRPIGEDQEPSPTDDYSESKLASERAATDICRAAGLNLAILRPVPIVGEGSRGNVARLIRAIDRKRFVWIGDGRNERSFVYVGDVAAAALAALYLSEDHVVLNVTGGKITVREAVETISEQLEVAHPRACVPNGIAKFAALVLWPACKLPVVGRYYRTLETWLTEAVYSGDAFRSRGYTSAVDIREGIGCEVKAYIESKR